MNIIKGKLLISIALVLLCASASFAWPACSGTWVAVAPEVGSTNGALYTDSHGETWQCQTKPSDPGNTNTNTNSNSNSNSNSNKNDQSQNQNQGQQQGQVANGGSAKSSSTASGGNATGGSVKDSGNSSSVALGGAGGSVKDSGNSSSVATGGSVKDSGNSSSTVKNSGNSASSSSVKDSGNSSSQAVNNTSTSSQSVSGSSSSGSGNTTDISTNVEAPKIPVATAYAPMIAPTVTCFKGASGAVQTMAAGVSFGVGRIDENCAILEAARSGAAYTGRIAFCKVYITNKYVKKAGVTLADCMQEDPRPAPVAQVPVPAPQAQPTFIIVPQPVPVAALAPPVAPVARNLMVERPIGICHFTNECKRLLDDAVLILKSNDHANVKIVGPSSDAALLTYLHDSHIPASRVLLQIEDSDSTSVSALITE